jgi:hypothetical protein
MFRRSILLSEVFAFAALLAASCSTDPGLISEQARDIALKASNSGHLRAIEAPSSVRTELLTLETADKQIGQSGDYWERQTPDMKVWLVTVEGTWAISGGPPTPEGTSQTPQAIFHQYTIVLDAMTGEIIGEMATS